MARTSFVNREINVRYDSFSDTSGSANKESLRQGQTGIIIVRHTPDQESLATGVSTVLFWPIQQELDCVSDSGQVVGKIKFDGAKNEYAFCPMDEALVLSAEQEQAIVERLAGLASGKYLIPMQDDD